MKAILPTTACSDRDHSSVRFSTSSLAQHGLSIYEAGRKEGANIRLFGAGAFSDRGDGRSGGEVASRAIIDKKLPDSITEEPASQREGSL